MILDIDNIDGNEEAISGRKENVKVTYIIQD